VLPHGSNTVLPFFPILEIVCELPLAQAAICTAQREKDRGKGRIFAMATAGPAESGGSLGESTEKT